jgi:hypothetical protein
MKVLNQFYILSQYFYNTVLSSIMKVFSILLEYFQDTLSNSIEPCTQCIEEQIRANKWTSVVWALSMPGLAVADDSKEHLAES